MESWIDELKSGRAHEAWDLFIDRYRALILATIRRLVADRDDVMDVFATVCEALSADDLARLRRFAEGHAGAAATAWVVTVVRNVAIDWLRHEHGRPRPAIPAGLSPLQREIYRAVCIDHLGHREAYERLSARAAAPLRFPDFLRELRATFRVARCPGDGAGRSRTTALPDGLHASEPDAAEALELGERLAAALAGCDDDVRAAVLLFVVDGVTADDVARLVGWPNAKSVYNRVYRALAALRSSLAREGIGPGDL